MYKEKDNISYNKSIQTVIDGWDTVETVKTFLIVVIRLIASNVIYEPCLRASITKNR